MVREETALVSPDAEMVDQQGARDSRCLGRVEASFEGGKEVGDIAIEITNFARDGTDELGLVGWEVCEGLRAFGVLDLDWVVSRCLFDMLPPHFWGRFVCLIWGEVLMYLMGFRVPVYCPVLRT